MPAPVSVWSSSRSSNSGNVWTSSGPPRNHQPSHPDPHLNGWNHSRQPPPMDDPYDNRHSYGAPYTPREHPQDYYPNHSSQASAGAHHRHFQASAQHGVQHKPQEPPVEEPGYPASVSGDWESVSFHRSPMLSGESPDFSRGSNFSSPAMLDPLSPELQAQLSNQLRSNRNIHDQCRTVYLGGLRSDLSYRLLLDNVRMKGVVLEGARILSEKRCAFITFVDPQAAVMFHAWCTIQAQNRDSKLNLNLASVPGHRIKVGWGSFHPVRTFILNAVSKGATRNVYLGNLDTDMDESFIHQHLERFGEIERIDVVPHKRLAFCHFVMLESAINAVTALFSDPMWNNRRIHYGRDRCSTTGGIRGSSQLSAAYPTHLGSQPGGPSPTAGSMGNSDMGYGGGRLSPGLPPQVHSLHHHGPKHGFQGNSRPSFSAVPLPPRATVSSQRASFPLFQQQQQQQQQSHRAYHQKQLRQSASGVYQQQRSSHHSLRDGFSVPVPDSPHPMMMDDHGNPTMMFGPGEKASEHPSLRHGAHGDFNPEDSADMFSGRSSLHSTSDHLSVRQSFGARTSTSTSGAGFGSRMAVSGASSTVSGPPTVNPPDWHRGAVFSATPISALHFPRPSWGSSPPASRLSASSSAVSMDFGSSHSFHQAHPSNRQITPPSRPISEEAEDEGALFSSPSNSVGNPLGWSPKDGYTDLQQTSSHSNSSGGEDSHPGEDDAGYTDRDYLRRDSVVNNAVAAAAAATQTFNARNVVMTDQWSPPSSNASTVRKLGEPGCAAALGSQYSSSPLAQQSPSDSVESPRNSDPCQTEGNGHRSFHDFDRPRNNSSLQSGDAEAFQGGPQSSADPSPVPGAFNSELSSGSAADQPSQDADLSRNSQLSLGGEEAQLLHSLSGLLRDDYPSQPGDESEGGFQMRASLPTPHTYAPSSQRLGGLRASAPNVLHVNGAALDPQAKNFPPYADRSQDPVSRPSSLYHYQRDQSRGSFVSLKPSNSSDSNQSFLTEMRHAVPGGLSHSTSSSSLQRISAGSSMASGTPSVSSAGSASSDPSHPSNTKRTVYMGNLTADQGGSAAAICSLVNIDRSQIESVRFMADKNCAFITFLDPKHSAIFHAAAVAVAASPQNLLSLQEQLRPSRSKRSSASPDCVSVLENGPDQQHKVPAEGELSSELTTKDGPGEDSDSAPLETDGSTFVSPAVEGQGVDPEDSLSTSGPSSEDDNLSNNAAHRMGMRLLRDRSLIPVYQSLLDIWRFVIPGKSLKVGWGTSNPKVIQAIHDAIINKGATRIICLMGVHEGQHTPAVVTEDFSAFCGRWGGEIESITLDMEASRVYTSFTNIRTAVRCFNTFLRPDWTTVGDYQSCSMQYARSVPKHAGTIVYAPHRLEPRRPQQHLLPHQHIQQQQQMQMLQPRSRSSIPSGPEDQE